MTPPDQILEEPSVRPPNKTNSEYQQRVVNTTDLSGLTMSERERETERERERKREREREKVRAILREELEVFATDDTDIGNVDHSKMNTG